MDTSSSTQTCKKKKKKLLNKTEDRISFLPEAILVDILSMLPTTVDVLRTSVLSTRWRYLWTSVPNFDFDDRGCNSKDTRRKFMKFVDRVLHFNDVPNIQKFSLSCGRSQDASCLNAWISTVLKRNVQELILHLDVSDPNLLLSRLFICDTLTTLKINVGGFLYIPNVICLPSLKVLHLNSIKFICHYTSQGVSFRLPTLQEFVLQDCKWVRIKVVNFFVPTLKEWTMYDFDLECFNEGCEIKVYAESLTKLDLETNLANELSLYNLSSLNTAFIDVFSHGDIGHRTRKLLQAVCNVRDLTISYSALWNCDIFEKDEDEDGWQIEAIPQCVLSHLKSVQVENFYGSKNELYLVEVLMKIARALVKINIESSLTLLKDPKKQIKVVKQLLGAPRESTCVINFS